MYNAFLTEAEMTSFKNFIIEYRDQRAGQGGPAAGDEQVEPLANAWLAALEESDLKGPRAEVPLGRGLAGHSEIVIDRKADGYNVHAGDDFGHLFRTAQTFRGGRSEAAHQRDALDAGVTKFLRPVGEARGRGTHLAPD